MTLSVVAIFISGAVFGWTVYWSVRSERRHKRERQEDSQTREEERVSDRTIREKEREQDARASRETVGPSPQLKELLERDSRRFNDPRQR